MLSMRFHARKRHENIYGTIWFHARKPYEFGSVYCFELLVFTTIIGVTFLPDEKLVPNQKSENKQSLNLENNLFHLVLVFMNHFERANN